MGNDLIGTVEAADILGVSHRTTKRLAQTGALPSVTKLRGRTAPYLFNRADVLALAAERRRINGEGDAA